MADHDLPSLSQNNSLMIVRMTAHFSVVMLAAPMKRITVTAQAVTMYQFQLDVVSNAQTNIP